VFDVAARVPGKSMSGQACGTKEPDFLTASKCRDYWVEIRYYGLCEVFLT
jgi:hypothetical protein